MNAIRAMLAQGRMAALAAAQGEADVAFAYDGAVFTPGTLPPSGYRRTVQVDLTIGGAPIPDGTYMIVVGAKAWLYDSFFSQLQVGVDSPSGADCTAWIPSNNGLTHVMYHKATGVDPLVLSINTDSDGEKEAHVFLELPSGQIAQTSFQIPGSES